jgi:F-type H+-transporting ATPase subunit gamma
MESAQNLKRRRKSVQNIGQITKAMELVAATKMRRSQEVALNSRPYAYTALELLGILAGMRDVPVPELLRPRPVERSAFLLVASDKGLAGSFNSAIFRKFETFVAEKRVDLRSGNHSFIAIGQKAKSYLEVRKLAAAKTFTRVGDLTKLEEVVPIADFLIDGFLRHEFDNVTAFFMTFVTALRQDATVREFLPVTYEGVKQSINEIIPRAGKYSEYAESESFFEAKDREYIIEPTPAEVLAELAPALLRVRLYHAILEANASEHSARRVAMKNASDNASELSEDLTVEYNKSRQAAITREIIEVTSGAQSMQ